MASPIQNAPNRFLAVRDTLGTGIYFATYESSKQLLTTFSGKDAHKNPIAVLAAGGLCGIVSWALICSSTGVCFLGAVSSRLTSCHRPHRLREEHLPAKRANVLEGPESAHTQDPVL